MIFGSAEAMCDERFKKVLKEKNKTKENDRPPRTSSVNYDCNALYP